MKDLLVYGHDHSLRVSAAVIRAGLERHSHHMPSRGSTSGTNPYPRPNIDHTESCWNISGCVSESSPTTTTPANSVTTEIQAARRIFRPLWAIAIVATMYTTAENAESPYATGASAALRMSWTAARAVAEIANTP